MKTKYGLELYYEQDDPKSPGGWRWFGLMRSGIPGLYFARLAILKNQKPDMTGFHFILNKGYGSLANARRAAAEVSKAMNLTPVKEFEVEKTKQGDRWKRIMP